MIRWVREVGDLEEFGERIVVPERNASSEVVRIRGKGKEEGRRAR